MHGVGLIDVTILIFQLQAQPAVEVARTERIGGGWTTEVIALAKMPRSLVRRCSQSGATLMKRGESSNGVDWPAGRMVLDMKEMIVPKVPGAVNDSVAIPRSLFGWQPQSVSVPPVDWRFAGNAWKATNASTMKSECGHMKLAHMKFLCMLTAKSAPI